MSERPGIVAVLLAIVLALSATTMAASPAASAEARSGGQEAALTNVAQVTAGGHHSCARLTNGQARCWGANGYGQLGDGTLTSRTRPASVNAGGGTGRLTAVAQIAAGGFHTCARLTNGLAACWGRNNRGQLGDGTFTTRRRPTLVSNPAGSGWLTGVAEVSTDDQNSCARLTSGQVVCWGDNASGQLGIGAATTPRPRPVTVMNGSGPLGGITQVSVGANHVCARNAYGFAFCWGSNSSGQLGSGANDLDFDNLWRDHYEPVLVHDASDPADILHGAVTVSAGGAHSCVLTRRGEARCWGDNRSGQLGDGLPPPVPPDDPPDNRPTHVAWPPTQSVVATGVTAGGVHTCALTTVGWACWGGNWRGQVGNGSLVDAIVPGTPSAPLYAQVSAGAAHTCARTAGGQAWCWGANDRGELGNGSTSDSPTPVRVG